jgi:hypothetical protein
MIIIKKNRCIYIEMMIQIGSINLTFFYIYHTHRAVSMHREKILGNSRILKGERP